MRNKRLNNKLTDSISKGGVLYRAGEIPTLNKEQIAQANLVSKLPCDFPFANWESMNTKQQLQQMQHSGLNNQDQWSLLNSNVPLSVLDQHNQVQDDIETRTSATRIAVTLMNAVAQATIPRMQAAVVKPIVSTSLQNNALRQKLDMVKEEVKKKPLGKAGGEVGAAVVPKDIGSVTPSPRPTPPPLPQPGPPPVVTPGVDKGTNPIGESTPIELTARDKQMLLGLLNMDKNLVSVSDRKLVELVERQVQKGDITRNQLIDTIVKSRESAIKL